MNKKGFIKYKFKQITNLTKEYVFYEFIRYI